MYFAHPGFRLPMTSEWRDLVCNDLAMDLADSFFLAPLISSTCCSKKKTIVFLPAAVDEWNEFAIFTVRLSAYDIMK